MPVDHGDRHPVCGVCWDERHPDTEPVVSMQKDAVRCEWCAGYTRTGIVEVADPDDVPRHKEDPAWMDRAGARSQPID